MTDKFMSGWGMARGKINKLVIECDNNEQARIIAKNASYREEMKHIFICTKKPNYSTEKYFTSFKTFAELGDIWKKQ